MLPPILDTLVQQVKCEQLDIRVGVEEAGAEKFGGFFGGDAFALDEVGEL